MKHFFTLKPDNLSRKTTLILILFAFIFSMGIRSVWVLNHASSPTSLFNNEVMINTNDGYWFAEGARDLLAGGHQPHDLSAVDEPLAQLTALIALVTPFSFETIILWMPAFFGSLLVVPLVLTGRALGNTSMGFVAALVGSIALSYYNRTMAGYYDTDMLTVVFPTFELFFLLYALTHQHTRHLIGIALSIALYQWWYPQAYSLDTALLAMMGGYTLLFDRKNPYLYKMVLFILVGILSLPLWAKIALALGLYTLFHKIETPPKTIALLFGAITLLYFITGGFDPIWLQLKAYVFREATSANGAGLHFYNVAQTVREAGQIPLSVFAERISGHPFVFFFALVGYGALLYTKRPFLLSLPLFGLGCIALVGGLRFTIYAVPVMALALGFMFVISTQTFSLLLRQLALATLTLLALYPNIIHTLSYQVPTVFSHEEVTVLESLKGVAKREDYVVSWWDYGYPIRYYSDVKTWVDGGKHTGDVNYPAALVLTDTNQTRVSSMMRLFTEVTEQRSELKNKTQTDYEVMLIASKIPNNDLYLEKLAKKEVLLPPKTRDVYLLLPLRMMEILPTVRLFSNLDLATGEEKVRGFFAFTQSGVQTQEGIDLGEGMSFNTQEGSLTINGQTLDVKTFYTLSLNAKGEVVTQAQSLHPNGEIVLIYHKEMGGFIVCDESYLHSTYIQMFLFENYDHTLFEKLPISNGLMKVFKLKG